MDATQIHNGIIPRRAAAEMVDAYARAQVLIADAFGKIDEAEKILHSYFPSEYKGTFSVLDRNDWGKSGTDLIRAVELRLRKEAWKKLVEHLEIKKTMSNKARDLLERRLDDDKDVLPITLENILMIMEGMAAQAPEYALAAILEAFEILTPGRNHWNEYKTNQTQARKRVGKKVILTFKLCEKFNGLQLNYGTAENEMMAVDKTFHLLDGKGPFEGYRGPLVDGINKCGAEGETTYFEWKGYLNGNLHLTFKRPDLVTLLNQAAGGKYLLTD